MIITLKNGQNIELDWNFLVLEYLEEYEGGLKALKRDINAQVNQMKIHNHFLYAIIRANYDDPLTYRQAVSLVNTKDTDKIGTFIKENMQNLEEFKKKEVKYPPNFQKNHQRR